MGLTIEQIKQLAIKDLTEDIQTIQRCETIDALYCKFYTMGEMDIVRCKMIEQDVKDKTAVAKFCKKVENESRS